MMKKFAVLADLSKPQVVQVVQDFRPWLEERVNIVLWCRESKELQHAIDGIEIDYILVLGGDGFLLSTARQLNGREIPVIGVNFGKLGFLAEFNIQELTNSITQILEGSFHIGTRMMLLCQVIRDGEVVFSTPALNDGMIKSGYGRMLYCKLFIDKQEIAIYGGDGIIVATPVGSTAYSLSAGGPVLSPTLSAFIITPICPHTLTLRPLIIPSHHCIDIQCVAPYPGDAMFTADGQVCFDLHKDDLLTITRSKQDFHVVETGRRNFFKILTEKFSWGEVKVRI